MNDYMDQLNKWADMYDQAHEDGVFDDAPKPPVPSPQTADDASFFGLQNTHATDNVRDVDAEYWNQVYELSKDDLDIAPDVTQPGTEVDDELLQEDEKIEEGHAPEKLTDKIKDHPMVRQASNPNPVEPWTLDKDQRRKVTPNWTDGQELQELDGLKRSLYDLECKLSGQDGLLENNEKVVKQLDDLKKQIDDLSDSLAPHSWQDRES